ncbi:2OG-Fe dioxygenase family protein [Acidomonas methanolica]|nr:2OG-Fe dioxygenase family protein [Acidomonas methanolica]
MAPTGVDPMTNASLSFEDALKQNGFAFVRAGEMGPLLQRFGLDDWDGFAASWNRLGLDRYMADGGRYRRRRYATWSLRENGDITRKRHQPHYQSRDYNLLNGGIERWFGPIEDRIGDHPALRAILRLARDVATDLTPEPERPESWHAEVHQFRIEARPDNRGHPTPEGMHRDGVDWVFVLMVARENVRSGETTIHDLQRRTLGSFTLERPMDTAIVDDHRVYHGVTAVEPVDPSRPAHRDVLVVTLRHE